DLFKCAFYGTTYLRPSHSLHYVAVLDFIVPKIHLKNLRSNSICKTHRADGLLTHRLINQSAFPIGRYEWVLFFT
ncbi:MAG: hypothetical protein Q8R43_00245, partial [Alphaproteobacteria bacterium]|nr:hypothetical protein [Alphaproteobacteria bacterium]